MRAYLGRGILGGDALDGFTRRERVGYTVALVLLAIMSMLS